MLGSIFICKGILCIFVTNEKGISLWLNFLISCSMTCFSSLRTYYFMYYAVSSGFLFFLTISNSLSSCCSYLSLMSSLTLTLKSRLLVKLTQYTLLLQASPYPLSWNNLWNYYFVRSMSSYGESNMKLSYFVNIGINEDFLDSLLQGNWSMKLNSLAWSTVSLSVRLAI